MHNSKEQPIIFKIILIGASGVGKTSLSMKYKTNVFSYDYQVTTGVDFITKQVQVNQKNTIKLQIWDTMGQQAFKSVVRSLYKGVAAVLLIYSIDNRQSFQQLGEWVNEIHNYASDETMLFLIGSKLDLDDFRQVKLQDGKKYGSTINTTFVLQISSKTGQNMKDLFDKLSKSVYKKYTSSSAFRQLIKPSVSMLEKTSSFQLNKDQDRIRKYKCC